MSPEIGGTVTAQRRSSDVPDTPAAATSGSAADGASDSASGSHRTSSGESIPVCANCGTAVPLEYCGNCGQRREHAVHSLWHFLQEATEDLTHADSRLWSTLAALMFKPGLLTCEFFAGRRARYLPPLRLYLVLSVVFFLVIGTLPQETRVAQVSTKLDTSSVTVEPVQSIDLTPRPGETPQQTEARVCDPHFDGPAKSFFSPLMRKGCYAMARDGGRGVREVFLHNAPRAMFLFLPVVAMIMMALYWRPRRYYVEHLLFSIHNHAFAFLLLTLLALLTRVLPDSIGDALTAIAWLYIPYYLFVGMRRVYGQSRQRTAAKLTVLSVAYLIGLALTIGLIGVYSVWSS